MPPIASTPWRRLDVLQLARRVGDRFLPRDLAPLVGDLLADHRLQLTVGMRWRSPTRSGPSRTSGPRSRRRPCTAPCARPVSPCISALKRAADAAVRARGEHGAPRLAHLDDGVLGERGRRAGLHAGAARDALGCRRSCRWRRRRPRCPKPRPSMVSANVPCTSSHARTQREQTMHFEESNVKYGLELVLRHAQVVVAGVAVAHVAQADRRPPCPAARSRRSPRTSGSPAGGR